MAARARLILIGEVTGIACYKEDENHVYTQVTLSVAQMIKGEREQRVVIRIPGGEFNGQVLVVEDAPSFKIEEKVVLFLKGNEGAFTVVVGFQGKFTIDKNDMVSGDMSLTKFTDQIKDILAKQ